MTWFVIPIQQGFYVNGEFVFQKRLKASLIYNLKFYAVFGGILVVFSIYVAVAHQMVTLKSWNQLVDPLLLLVFADDRVSAT